jgi:ubiquinone/menaquinone biosynthesis C-methylase UbiE
MFESLGRQLRKPSGFYGRLVSRMMNKRNKLFYERIIKELDIKRGEKVFEIGYGPGLGISLIANTIEGCSISGIDFSELMHQEAIKRNKSFVVSGIVDLQFGDFLNHQFDIEKYDKIFCLNVIYFWSDLHLAFSKTYSLMNSGGMFCIFMTHKDELEATGFTNLAKDFNKYSIETVEAELMIAGFQSVEYIMDNGYFIKAIK